MAVKSLAISEPARSEFLEELTEVTLKRNLWELMGHLCLLALFLVAAFIERSVYDYYAQARGSKRELVVRS